MHCSAQQHQKARKTTEGVITEVLFFSLWKNFFTSNQVWKTLEKVCVSLSKYTQDQEGRINFVRKHANVLADF